MAEGDEDVDGDGDDDPGSAWTITELLERLCELSFPEADEGDEHVQLHPPATAEFRVELSRRLGGPLVPELDEFLCVTTGIETGPIEMLDIDDEDYGYDLERMVRVYDYGNGDCVLMEQHEDACRLWWIGHDSYECMLVARSLHEYLSRLVSEAEAVAAGDEEFASGFTPEYELELACSPSERLAAETDEVTREWLRTLPPDARVFDLSGEPTPIELTGTGAYISHHGELVAMEPSPY